MNRDILIEPISAAAFARFGDIIEPSGEPSKIINRGMCARFSDLARLDFGADGRAGISIFEAKSYALPLKLEMMERHPEGSQAFLPLGADPFLVIVAADETGRPGRPRAFMTSPGQGINYHRGTWHGVLTPIDRPARFAVVDRIGVGANLEEYWFDLPFQLIAPAI